MILRGSWYGTCHRWRHSRSVSRASIWHFSHPADDVAGAAIALTWASRQAFVLWYPIQAEIAAPAAVRLAVDLGVPVVVVHREREEP